jgi:phage tail-like protein
VTTRQDPLLGFQFSLQIQGGPVSGEGAYFRELSGFGSEYEVAEYRTIDEKGLLVVQKVPGRVSYTPLTLKRGITADLSLWHWHRKVAEDAETRARAEVTIILYDRNYNPVIRWNLARAWPSKISGPQFQADSTDIGLEELTLVYEGITQIEGGGSG